MTITDLFDALGIDYRREGEHHHVRAGWVGLDCFSCSPGEGRFRLGVNLTTRACTCWMCGKTDLYAAVQDATGKAWGEVRDLLKGVAREQAPTETRLRGKLVVPKGVGPLKPAHVRYLRGRGFDPKAVEKMWKVQGIGNAARLAWRLFLPVHLKAEVASWTTRSVSDKVRLRYISAAPEEERYSLKSLLYGEQFARNAVVVVEGPLDVWKLGPGAVCTFGLSYTKAQLRRMSRFPVRAVWFDKEPGAQRRARQLVNDLKAFPGDTYLVEADADDPGSASERELKQVRKTILGR